VTKALLHTNNICVQRKDIVKRTDPSSELGRPDGRTRHGTGMCHRHGMCGQDGMGHRDRMCHRDGMCHRELFGPIHLRASFRGSAPKAGAYFFTRFRPFHSCHHCGVACQESWTNPSFPHAASQPNVYLKSAPSGAFQKFNRFIMTIVHIQSSTDINWVGTG
jgi:hypothetical protein